METKWYVTRKPSNDFQLYDFARSATQAKDMLRDLAEGSPIAHKSKSQGGLYNIYVKKGSVLWREKGGSADGGSTYAGGGEVEYVVSTEIEDEDGNIIDLGLNVDDKSKTVKPTHGYYPNHPLSKKAKAWAKKNGYTYSLEQGGSTYAGGGEIFASSEEEAMNKAEDNIREQNPQYEDSSIDIKNFSQKKRFYLVTQEGER